jgi:tryptophan synthase alpha chain
MSRYQAMFQRLANNKEGAFIPFVVLLDPDPKTSKEIILTLIEAGADALELGIAFSDPLADGPTVQKANIRVLKNGSHVRDALNLVKEIRAENQEIPLGILTYANLVFKNSLDWFYGFCHECGVDSVLVADVPLLEATDYCSIAIAHGIDPVLIAPINLPLQRCKEIARLGRGYTYVVTRKGVTGADEEVFLRHRELLQALKDENAPKPILGFGISSWKHVKAAVLEGASGVISGSRVISIIEENLNNKQLMLKNLFYFVKTMKQATKSCV